MSEEFSKKLVKFQKDGRVQTRKNSIKWWIVKKLDDELLRLQQLNKRNQSIRPAEIDYFANQKTSALAHLKNASANLQAVRIIINT